MKKHKDTPQKEQSKNEFYFGKGHYRLMLVGLACIILGFILMLGYGANTTPSGTYDANYWNEEIFSFRRIRVAPFLVILGFAIQAYTILKRKK